MSDFTSYSRSRKSFLSHFPSFQRKSYRERLPQNKVKKIIDLVNIRYSHLSPSGCSRNILATNSNLDKEIETVKQKILTPDPQIKRFFSELELSPVSHKLPKIMSTQLKKDFSKTPSPADFNQTSNHTISPLGQNSRINRIDDIIKDCRNLESDLSKESTKSKIKLKKNNKYFDGIFKILRGGDVEKNLIERCRIHGQEVYNDRAESVKVANALKRGKKV